MFSLTCQREVVNFTSIWCKYCSSNLKIFFITPLFQILIRGTNVLTLGLLSGQRDLRPLVRWEGGCIYTSNLISDWLHVFSVSAQKSVCEGRGWCVYGRGCHPSFRAPADPPDTKPCPAQDQLTTPYHSQSITTASGRQQCAIKVQDLYLCHNDHETLLCSHCTSTLPQCQMASL